MGKRRWKITRTRTEKKEEKEEKREKEQVEFQEENKSKQKKREKKTIRKKEILLLYLYLNCFHHSSLRKEDILPLLF